MKSKPKISVIMSVYNGTPLGPQSRRDRARTAYLKEATRSILEQTYKNFEFIIIDDASTDDTLQYLNRLKDKRIKLIKNKKNLGLAASLNIGLKIAKGDYIARMDADDVSLPNRFEEQIKFMTQNPSVDLCGTWADLIDENGKRIGEKKYPTRPDQIKNAITWYTPVVHPTYMAKKSLFKKLGGYRLNFDYAEDYDLLARAKNNFEIANIPQKLLLWRLQDKRRSRSNMAKMDKIDLKIKIESIKRDGISLSGFLAITKKLILTYLFPSSLKLKISTFSKRA